MYCILNIEITISAKKSETYQESGYPIKKKRIHKVKSCLETECLSGQTELYFCTSFVVPRPVPNREWWSTLTEIRG